MDLRISAIQGALLAALSLAAMPLVMAQAYPSKPIRLLVPYAPGGKSDTIGRVIAKRLEGRMGQPVIVDNRPGAGGNLATDIVAKANPDAYTLLVGAPGPVSISVSLYKNLPYDPLKDLAPVTLVVSTANVLVVHPGLGVSSVKELIAYGKANPGKLNFASGGVASAGHLAVELFNTMAGIKMVHIPYKGANPALLDVIAGRVPLIITNMPAAWPFVKDGKLKALAVTTATRSPAAPDLPTVAQAGVPGYESDNWTGILAPGGTPKALVNRLHSEIARGMSTPDVKDMMAKLGADMVNDGPDKFRKLIEREIAMYRKVIKASGATAL